MIAKQTQTLTRPDESRAAPPYSSAAPESTATNTPPRSRHFRFKRYVDPMLAAILLIPGLPLIGLLILLVRLTSKGPGLFRQRRVGEGGQLYWMYKIRTMVHNAEALTGPTWTQKNDPRVTRVGYVLRKLHLDELPQLINVLCGDMYLCGPRPERPEIVPVLSEVIPGYVERLAVRPGITGLAQINLPPDTTVGCVQRKLVLDREYIQTATFVTDNRIFACSLLRLVGIPGETAMTVMGLKRTVHLDPALHPLHHTADGENGADPRAADETISQLLERQRCLKPYHLVQQNGDGNGNGNGHGEDKHPENSAADANGNVLRPRSGNATNLRVSAG